MKREDWMLDKRNEFIARDLYEGIEPNLPKPEPIYICDSCSRVVTCDELGKPNCRWYRRV